MVRNNPKDANVTIKTVRMLSLMGAKSWILFHLFQEEPVIDFQKNLFRVRGKNPINMLRC